MCEGVCVGGGRVCSHPDSVCLSQSHRVGQLDLDLSAVERTEHTHNLQQPVVQPAGSGHPSHEAPSKI